MAGSQRIDSKGEERGVGMERSVGKLGNYFDDDNRKQGLKVDYAYYRERSYIRIAGHRRASKGELVVGELPREVAEEPAAAAAADVAVAVAYVDETDTDCKSCKN